MGIRTNWNLEQHFQKQATKWDPILSRIYCTSHERWALPPLHVLRQGFEKNLIWGFLREAHLLSGVLNLKCSCCFVLLLRKIIHFCEGEMEGPRIVLPTGSLTHRFFGVRKVDHPKLALRNSIGRFRDPFFGRKKLHFWKKSAKSGHGVLPGGKGAKITLFWTDVRSTWIHLDDTVHSIWMLGASRPCRARCI